MNSPKIYNHVLPDMVEPVNKYFHVPIAARIVKTLVKTPVMPNQVTYASIFFGLGAAYAFSLGDIFSMMVGGLLLEVNLILDCVDGQLARAKNCSSEWGRFLDGIGGYISYLSVIIGVMVGLGGYYAPLAVFTVATILKAISYDYCKRDMTSLVQNGYSDSQKDIFDTYEKINQSPSGLLKAYYYYLQLQQAIFGGCWIPLDRFDEDWKNCFSESTKTQEQRRDYYQKAKPIMAIWKWNGPDLALFLFFLVALFGGFKSCLSFIAYALAVQFFLTLLFHHYLIRNEKLS